MTTLPDNPLLQQDASLLLRDAPESRPSLHVSGPRIRKGQRLCAQAGSLARATGLALATFLDTCPWTFEQMLGDDVFPEGKGAMTVRGPRGRPTAQRAPSWACSGGSVVVSPNGFMCHGRRRCPRHGVSFLVWQWIELLGRGSARQPALSDVACALREKRVMANPETPQDPEARRGCME